MSEPPDTADGTNVGRLAYLPVSLFGAVVALSGMTLAWRLAATEWELPAWVGEALGLLAAGAFVVLMLAYGIKCVQSPAAMRAEFAHPVAATFFATPIISLLLLPAVVAPYAVAVANALWVTGTMAMIGFPSWIVSGWTSVPQQVAHATPAWMVPVVGALNIAIAGVDMDVPGAQAIDLFASSLFYLAVFMFMVLVPKLLRLRSSSPFGLSWWPVGFPLAAMTNASLKFVIHRPSWSAHAFALAMLASTTFVTLSLSVRTIMGIIRGNLRALTS